MSICGNCPWPYEIAMNPEEFEEYSNWGSIDTDGHCNKMCSFQDAAYSAQYAYDLCLKRLERFDILAGERLILLEEALNRLKKYEDISDLETRI
jgi:hypothetical protein